MFQNEDMLAEISKDRKELYLMEGDVVYKTYRILLVADGCILFWDGISDPAHILGAVVTFHPDGSLATFRQKIHPHEWQKMHQLYKDHISKEKA